MIIGISGKLNSGKDTVGEIMQIISASPHFTDEAVLSFIGKQHLNSKWEIKRFADKLKDIVCMLLGCSREQLEDREFKEKELGEQWYKYRITYRSYTRINGDCEFYDEYYTTEKEALNSIKGNLEVDESSVKIELTKLTPRLLLQLLGTECGRQIIHPNIWVNALMSEYVEDSGYSYPVEYMGLGMSGEQQFKLKEAPKRFNNGYPNFIITDTRFLNELEAVKSRGGLSIRVNRISSCECGNNTDWNYSTIKEGSNRYCKICNKKQIIKNEHESETSLDSVEFDYTIQNDGTLLELVEKVREILTKEKII